MRHDDPGQLAAADLSARLEASRMALMDGIAGLDEEGFWARPDTSAWSAAEVLAHLLASERLLAQQAQTALAEEGFVITPMTQDERHEQARLAQRMAVPQILHGLLAQRRDTVRLLEGFSSQQLARSLRHSRWGERSVAWLFQRASEHEAEHTAQLGTLRATGGADIVTCGDVTPL